MTCDGSAAALGRGAIVATMRILLTRGLGGPWSARPFAFAPLRNEHDGASEVYRDSFVRRGPRVHCGSALTSGRPPRMASHPRPSYRFATFPTLTSGYLLFDTPFSAAEEGSCVGAGSAVAAFRFVQVMQGSGAIEINRARTAHLE